MAPKNPGQEAPKKHGKFIKIFIGCSTALVLYFLVYLSLMVFLMRLDRAEMLEHLGLWKGEPLQPAERLTEAERVLHQEQWRAHHQRLASIYEQSTEGLVRDMEEIHRSWSLDEDESCTAWSCAPRQRASIQLYSAQVTCWPSSGGFWTTHLDAVDLDFLGLNRLHDTPPSADPAEEDRFCKSLSRFGPTWYKDEEWYHYCETGDYERLGCVYPNECPPPPIRKPPTFYSYPSTGGLWVLQLGDKQELTRSGRGKLNNAFNMDEKARVIEMLGGRYIAEPQDYWRLHDEQLASL